MYKTPTFAEPQQCNRPFSTGQLSAFIIQLVTWQVLPRSERKNKISCNKKVKKNYQKQVPVRVGHNKGFWIVPRFCALLSCLP
jgi:hypothetical protein